MKITAMVGLIKLAVVGVFAVLAHAAPIDNAVKTGSPTMVGQPGLGVPNIQVYPNQESFMANRSADNALSTRYRLIFSNNLNETVNLFGEAWANHNEPHLFYINVTGNSQDLSLPIDLKNFVRINNIHGHFEDSVKEISTKWSVKRGCNGTVCADDNQDGALRRTLGEATWKGLNSPEVELWYNLGNVDGYNVPMQIILMANQTKCKSINMADVDPSTYCPPPNLYEFEVNGTTQYGCASDCKVYGTPEACCTGEYKENLNKQGKACPPSSTFFWKPYPELHVYVYDDLRGVKVCHNEAVDLLTNIGPPLSEERIKQLKSQFAIEEENEVEEKVEEVEDEVNVKEKRNDKGFKDENEVEEKPEEVEEEVNVEEKPKHLGWKHWLQAFFNPFYVMKGND